eukprot:GEMP01000791.1.p1 GENE.GEMP01000791.1~~GEMP01000791.1.p1  ORF type:complete len:755 (-),score=164.40 GEMP01000791.1:3791-6055(-)
MVFYLHFPTCDDVYDASGASAYIPHNAHALAFSPGARTLFYHPGEHHGNTDHDLLRDASHTVPVVVSRHKKETTSFLHTDDWAQQVADRVKTVHLGGGMNFDSVDVPYKCASGTNYRDACPMGWQPSGKDCMPVRDVDGKYLTPTTPEKTTMLFPRGAPWRNVGDCREAFSRKHGGGWIGKLSNMLKKSASDVCSKCPGKEKLSFAQVGTDDEKKMFERVCKVKWPCKVPADGSGLDYSSSHGNMCPIGWSWNERIGGCKVSDFIDYRGPCHKERPGAAFATPWMKRQWATMCNVRYEKDVAIGSEPYEIQKHMVAPTSRYPKIRMAALDALARMKNISSEADEWWNKSNGDVDPNRSPSLIRYYHQDKAYWSQLDQSTRLGIMINKCVGHYPTSVLLANMYGKRPLSADPELNALDLGCAESVRETLISMGYTPDKSNLSSVLFRPEPIVLQAYPALRSSQEEGTPQLPHYAASTDVERELLRNTFGNQKGFKKLRDVENCVTEQMGSLNQAVKKHEAEKAAESMDLNQSGHRKPKPLNYFDALMEFFTGSKDAKQDFNQDCGLWDDFLKPALEFPLNGKVPLSLTFAAAQSGFVPHVSPNELDAVGDGRILFWPNMPHVQSPKSVSNTVSFANNMYSMLGSQGGKKNAIAGRFAPAAAVFMKRHEFIDSLNLPQDCTRNYYSACPAMWTKIDLPAGGTRCDSPAGYDGPCERSFEGSRLSYTMKRAFAEHCNAPWPCENEVFITPIVSQKFF